MFRSLPSTVNTESLVGTYKGVRILAISTGMGGASVAIGIEELKISVLRQ